MLSSTSALALSAALLFFAPMAPQEGTSLLLISKQGETSSLPTKGLSLADPRTRGAWSVRPQGFAAAKPQSGDEDQIKVLVQLSNGDSLRGELGASAGETLGLSLLGGVQIPILIDHITRIQVGPLDKSKHAQALDAPAEGDRVYRRTLRELDAIDGTFDSFVEDGVQFESTALGLKVFGWDEVAALIIEDLGGQGSEGSDLELPVILDLQGGSRLRGQLLGLEEKGCRLEVAGQAHLFPWETVEELLVDDGSLRYLSDLPVLREEGRGQIFGDEFEVVWPHALNRCVWKSGPLRTGGRVYRRGIGTHAPTQVTWAVPSGTLFLRGLVGIDDSALYNEPEFRGSVIFRVKLDGKLAWESGLITGGSQPVRLPLVDMQNAKEVTLEADMAGSYEGDRANWLEMSFVR